MISRIAAAVVASLIFCTCFPVAVDAASGSDVLVVGGTPAGVAAAIAAARRGENVTLVAARPVLGGVLTDATMDQWDLNLAPNTDTEVEGGIFREIYAELGDSFSPGDAARVFGALVASEPRIHTIVNATPASVRVSGPAGARQIDDVTFAHAGGQPFTVGADTVIDATDNGDVTALAGARYDLGRQDTGIDEKMQAVTLMFTIDGVNWTDVLRDYDPAKYGPGGALDDRAWGYSKLMDAYRPSSPDVLVRDLNLGHDADGSVSVNAIDVIGINGLLPNDLIRARVLTESEAPRVVDYLRAHLAGFADARLGTFADTIYVRETRHILGDEWLTADDVWDGVMPADTIGLSSYPLDLHPVTATDKLAYAAVRHVYGIPLGTLLPKGFTNLMLASPAISASHEASGSARVIPSTIEEGEAAGAAAALARERKISLATLSATPDDVTALQTDLRDHGAILNYKVPAGVAYGAASGRKLPKFQR